MSKQPAAAETKPKKEKVQTPEQETQRRDFLKVSVAAGIGACAVGMPLCSAVRLMTDPVFTKATTEKFYAIANLDSLTERPQKFNIVDDKNDAWMTLSQQKIGSVFLRRSGTTVRAFHTLCPHAGCVLQIGTKTHPQTGTDEELFYCPCHSALFDLDGNRLDAISPRNMDSLEVKIEEGHVSVKFENFAFGIAAAKKSI